MQAIGTIPFAFRMWGRLRGRPLLIAMGLAFGASCNNDRAITAPEPTSDQLVQAVAGDAAAAITDGKFVLSAPEASLAEQISVGHALALATAWSRQFGPLGRSWFEKDRGGSIRFDKLTPCGRPLFAVSGFYEPALDVLPSVRRAVGPWWLVTLCDGGTPNLSVSVSAWATELRLEGGKIAFPPNSGAEFSAIGIPIGHVGEYPSSPERARWQ